MLNEKLIELLNEGNGELEKVDFLERIVLKIQDLNQSIDTLSFHRCTFQGLHLFTGVTRPLKLVFYNCRIEELSLETKVSHRLEIWDNSTVVRLNLYEAVCSELIIHESRVEYIHTESPLLESIHIQASTVDKLSFFSVVEPYKVRIAKSTVKELEMTECAGAAELSISQSEVSKIIGYKSPISSLRITDNNSMNSIFLTSSTVDMAYIKNYTNTPGNSIVFQNIKFGKLYVSNYSGQGEFDILSCKIRDFQFTDSVIAKGKINSVDFRNSTQIVFSRSNITSWMMFNITWSKEYQLTEFPITDEASSRKTWEVMESYRQLKTIYQRQNNHIEGSLFSRHELRMFYRIVHNKVLRWRLRHLGNFLILGTSKHLSGFGQSVARPLVGLFMVHAVLFWSLLLTNPNLPVRIVPLEQHDWPSFWQGLNLYAYTLLPTHSSSVDAVPIWGVIDVIMRISAGYFIFYFLRATRKFHTT